MKLKIDPETKHQNLAQHVKFQLGPLPVENIRFSIIIMVLIMYDLPLILGVLSTSKLMLLWLVLPFAVILHIWVIRLMIKNPYSTQFETVLFMGIWGLLGFISLMVMVEGMSYYTLHVTSPLYYIVINAVTLLLMYILVKYQIDKFAGDPTKERKRSNQSKYMGLLAVAPAIGYMLEPSIRGTAVLEDVVILMIIYMLAMFLAALAAKFLHRYFFMRANMDYVAYQPHTKKEREKLMKQGVEIK